MDHERRIKRAVKLLKPTDDVAARRDLDLSIKDIEETRQQNQHLEDLYSKDARKALDEFHASLRRAAAAYRKLPKGMAQTFVILHGQHGLRPLALDAVIKITASMQKDRRRRRSKIDYVKLGAAATAWNLFGLLQLTPPSRPKRKGDLWPRLAATLAGSPDESFLQSCRLYYEQAIAPPSKDTKRAGARSGLKKSPTRT
ncbi:hypothetical protein [Bradyrhizobium elkanii]|uniref:hypothetical protein n=1 Tax=Bradyrhizobium elkanii TaxID=29448 RepID=UPI001BA65476|nr:hypothetical protein [Bradyrhizobium elkanii]MBR1164244.1 hypothetical protein [Bradyrhizobium elkanii]